PSASDPGHFEQLLREARAGSREAFGQLLHLFRRYLLRLGDAAIVPGLRPKGGAADLGQDTFLAARQAVPPSRGQPREGVGAWLRTIFVRHLSNFGRDYQCRQKRLVTREVSLDDDRADRLLLNRLAARGASPDSEAIRSEQARLLHQAIHDLPLPYRVVVQ